MIVLKPVFNSSISSATFKKPILSPAQEIVLPDKREITVGRTDENDFQIDFSSVSAKHARITPKDTKTVCVEDLRSTNGTFVNGMRISKAELAVGDTITFGKSIQFQVAAFKWQTVGTLNEGELNADAMGLNG